MLMTVTCCDIFIKSLSYSTTACWKRSISAEFHSAFAAAQGNKFQIHVNSTNKQQIFSAATTKNVQFTGIAVLSVAASCYCESPGMTKLVCIVLVTSCVWSKPGGKLNYNKCVSRTVELTQRTDIFPLYTIRSTFGSRPKN